jgi:hypothetical protein
MPSVKGDDLFSSSLTRVEQAVKDVERLLKGEGLEAARTLVSALLEVHREALEELFQPSNEPRTEAYRRILCRPKVAWLLGLHGVNPEPLAGRARVALDAASVAPETRARAEIVTVDDEKVVVRIVGDSEGERRELAGVVERALSEVAPEATIVFEGAEPPPLDSGLFSLDPEDRPS